MLETLAVEVVILLKNVDLPTLGAPINKVIVLASKYLLLVLQQ